MKLKGKFKHCGISYGAVDNGDNTMSVYRPSGSIERYKIHRDIQGNYYINFGSHRVYLTERTCIDWRL